MLGEARLVGFVKLIGARVQSLEQAALEILVARVDVFDEAALHLSHDVSHARSIVTRAIGSLGSAALASGHAGQRGSPERWGLTQLRRIQDDGRTQAPEERREVP